MNHRTLFFRTLGWGGMLVILAAYILVSFEFLSPRDTWYPILNAVGALGIMIDSIWHHRAYPVGTLNIIWFLIAIITLVRILV
jgi:hypothetical protein